MVMWVDGVECRGAYAGTKGTSNRNEFTKILGKRDGRQKSGGQKVQRPKVGGKQSWVKTGGGRQA